MPTKAELMKNGDLIVRLESPESLEWLYEFLTISKEKKKYCTITVNGKEMTNPATELLPADKITVTLDERYRINDETPMYYGAVPIVYEDDWCLVANKKPFLLVHGDGQSEDTLTARVNAYLNTNAWPFAAQAVNRIDYEASGLVLFCKYPLLQHFFDEQMENGEAKKEYLAVVDGRVENREIDINNPISRNRNDAKKMIVFKKGKPAHTHISRLKLFNDKTLVKAVIDTGRKHQIRVHLSNLGSPIMNDPLYGTITNNKGLMLQAFSLSFIQPFTHERINVRLTMDTRFNKWFDPTLAEEA